MRYLFGWARILEKEGKDVDVELRRYRIVEISVWLGKSSKEGKEVGVELRRYRMVEIEEKEVGVELRRYRMVEISVLLGRARMMVVREKMTVSV